MADRPSEPYMRALVADADRAGHVLAALRSVDARIGEIAERVSDASVAVLSALPLTNDRPTALGFLADAMEANAAAMTALVALQRSAAEVLEAEGERVERLHADVRAVAHDFRGEA